MQKLRLYIIIIVLTVSHLLANAQYNFRLINTSNGLPDDEVKALFWTPDGKLGVRTSSSLSIFDGYTFHSVSPMGNEGYATDYVSALPKVYLDAKQRVWIKELGQFLVFDLPKDAYVKDVKDVLAQMDIKERIHDFFIDSAHDFWFVTSSGKLFMVKASQPGEAENKAVEVKITGKDLRGVCRSQGNHWFVYSHGLVVGMNAQMTQTISRQQLWKGDVPVRDFMEFAQDKDQLWLMWNHGVANYDAKAHQWRTRFKNDKLELVTICANSDGTANVSIRQMGLLTLTPDGKSHIETDIQTIDGETVVDDIQAIACRQGNLFLGLSGKGLCFYHPNLRRFSYHSFSSLGLHLNTYRVNQYTGGKVLLTPSNGVFALDAQNGKVSTLPIGGSDYIRSIIDSKGRIWSGTFRKGFYCRENGKVEHFQQGGNASKDINYDIVRGFLEDSQHRIWVNYQGGIGLFDEQRKRIVPLTDNRLERYKVVNDFKEDRQQRIWVASTQGLFVYTPATMSVLFPKDIVKDPAVSVKLGGPCKTLLIDSHRLVWVGTLNGLFVINPSSQTARFLGKQDGMPNEMINGMIEDKYGNVWVTTSNGLCRFSPVGDGDKADFKLMVFDSQNKLRNANFGWMTTGQLANGNLFFGVQDGYYVVDPSQVKEMKYTGHPIFTSLHVNNQEIVPGKEYDGKVILSSVLSATDKLVLRYDENFITIHFSGLNYEMPSHTYYKYRLKGMNEHWIETSPQDGIGVANYTDLAPGRYELEVYSAGSDKVWSKQSIKLQIIVEPPFWATWWAKTLYALLFIGILIFGFRWKMEQNRKRLEEEKYKELEEMKYRFFTNISHEFRTLLTLIITPIGSVLKRTKDEETRSQLNDVSRNAGDLLQLVNQLLDFRKMEMNGEKLNLSSGNLNEFIQYTAMKFTPLSEQKNILLSFDDKTNGIFMYFDHDKMGKILTNLLSNAFKFTKAGGKVTVSLESCILDSRRYSHIVVEDTGCGISKEEQVHVFERFYRAEQEQANKQIGSGIGLNMVLEYVKLHQGNISLESEVGKGSRFIVDIPTDLKHVLQQESSGNVADGASSIVASADAVDGAMEVQTTKKIEKSILVVEDNDDFRSFLHRELSHKYSKLLVAKDGLEGALMAETENPDLVVSDVMMPRMNGTDMCRRIKENIETSHIPVILLTAWSTDEGRAEGYKAGADAYIAKPFNMEVLLARIANLLEKQEKRRQDFSHSISLDPKTVTDSTPDEAFLNEIIGCIEKNINNSEYTIDSLAADVVMSRMSLYRKMKSLTGQTPADFIRTVRLKTAAKLLKDGSCNVSEACYRVGFASPQNFTKHFKEMFGVLPSQYS